MTATAADIAAEMVAKAPSETLAFLAWVGAIGSAHCARRHGVTDQRTQDFFVLVEAMVIADAAIMTYRYEDSSESDVVLAPNPLAESSEAFALLQWAWQVDAGGNPPAPVITDPAVRAWAARRAATQVERKWAMRLLAHLGVAA